MAAKENHKRKSWILLEIQLFFSHGDMAIGAYERIYLKIF
ncbi:hypothetical protein FUSO3_00250 [Fusobacterium necrophorum BL]|uniref:Uncharacterized protein n=1 Tax=Fusobacterium necrophorum BL TaxID=1441732 RepID=A0AB73BZP1_9FUSO|nr:hypothetical protein FUSO3_00250 [Fusobacterium necrophorum BL]